MARFCGNCSAEIADGVEFCGNCGAPAPAAAPVADIVKVGSFEINKKKLPVIGVAAVAVIAVIVLLISLIFGGGGYKSAMDNYVDVMNGKASKIEKLAPKEYWKYVEEEEDVTVKEIKKAFEEYYEEALKDNLEDEYGKNVKYSYKINDKKELSKKKLEACAEAISDKYDIKESKVKALYELEVELKTKGSEDEEEDEDTAYVVKIGSKWYPIEFYMSGDEASVSFAADMFVMIAALD